MKILFVYSYICVDIVNGRYYHNFLESIIKRYKPLGKLTICVSCKHCTSSMMNNVSLNGVKVHFISKENTIKKRFLDRRDNKQTIHEQVNECDWVIAHVPDSIGELAIKFAKQINKPCLAVVVGCPWDTLWNHSWKGKMMAPLSYFTMHRTMRLATYAIYVTSHFLQNRYPCTGRSIGCSDADIPASDESILRKRLQKIIDRQASDCVKLATCAAVHVRFKGQHDVIRAIAQLQKQKINVHYYLIGGGDASFLQNLAKKLGIEQFVHFMGLQPHEKIFSLLDEMDGYIQPSLTEGLPRALVEAMSRALPCIGTKVGGIPELLEADYLYHPKDIRNLVRLIAGFSKEKMQKSAIANFKRASEYQGEVLNRKRVNFLNQIKAEIIATENL